jgi:gluconolactonase
MASIAVVLAVLSPAAVAHGADPVFRDKAQLKELWNEGEFTEGVAVRSDGQVFFSDIPSGQDAKGRILQFDPASQTVSVFSKDSRKSNGLFFDANDRLLACCGANGGAIALCEIQNDGTVTPLVERFEGKRFNSPNDLVVHPSGRVYFSDPRYVGFEPLELKHQSVYLYEPATHQLKRVTDSISKPNGVHTSPDGSILYVAETDNGSTGEGHPKTPVRMTLNAFDIADNGTLSNKRVLVNFGDQLGIDGMTIDHHGRIFAAVRSANGFGIVVYSPDGEELDRLATPSLPTNCCLGVGNTKNTLYVTAGGAFYQIQINQ